MIHIKGDVVEFRYRCGEVRSVHLAGDFNDWSVRSTPMDRVAEDLWLAELRLAPGDYRFRYYVRDRGWITDWAAFGVERNPFGEWNSIVHVPLLSRLPTVHNTVTDAQVEPAPEEPHLLLRSVAGHVHIEPVDPSLVIAPSRPAKRIRKSPAKH